MNILPKKRWHVRTRDNIARKSKDENAAFEVEKKRTKNQQLSECEARLHFLRSSSSLTQDNPGSNELRQGNHQSEHVNLFSYKFCVKSINKDFVKERKEQEESYEKQIGFLTYLGQNSNEILRTKSWFEIAPRQLDKNNSAKNMKNKKFHDPLNKMNVSKPTPIVDLRKKVGKRNITITAESKTDCMTKSKGVKTQSLEKLRAQRFKRELKEKIRQKALLDNSSFDKQKETTVALPVHKYHNQFNPILAKQNNN